MTNTKAFAPQNSPHPLTPGSERGSCLPVAGPRKGHERMHGRRERGGAGGPGWVCGPGCGSVRGRGALPSEMWSTNLGQRVSPEHVRSQEVQLEPVYGKENGMEGGKRGREGAWIC